MICSYTHISDNDHILGKELNKRLYFRSYPIVVFFVCVVYVNILEIDMINQSVKDLESVIRGGNSNIKTMRVTILVCDKLP